MLLDKSASIIKKQTNKPIGFKKKVNKNNKLDKAEKGFVTSLKEDNVLLKGDQILGLGVIDEKQKIEQNLLNIMKGKM